MDGVTIEKADYIITHYPALLTEQEGMALKHRRYTVKFSETNDTGLTRMYLKTGRLTTGPLILDYLKDGYVQFALNCAGRIMKECPEKVFFNYCPNAANWPAPRGLNNAGFVKWIGIDWKKIDYLTCRFLILTDKVVQIFSI
ncbi:hypothetical protein FPZ43_08805 [Mucilaginibacter pallidiroseus]|uniref:Uncharacterized protein n=1 Tax=Mucilaginibacter pallidiroseus TaxID=2599295 RepID=A0A563UEZ5_9SPHI|nr:hypothetical protein [Mucilaginibacter pallidiroseus]TWR29940.1 hypothetical protein FPZ43_08805 [Mucilaginibacter pallidiroseus]